MFIRSRMIFKCGIIRNYRFIQAIAFIAIIIFDLLAMAGKMKHRYITGLRFLYQLVKCSGHTGERRLLVSHH